VEVQVSFIVVPLRDQKSQINVILRSISLLKGKFTQVVTQFLHGGYNDDDDPIRTLS